MKRQKRKRTKKRGTKWRRKEEGKRSEPPPQFTFLVSLLSYRGVVDDCAKHHLFVAVPFVAHANTTGTRLLLLQMLLKYDVIARMTGKDYLKHVGDVHGTM